MQIEKSILLKHLSKGQEYMDLTGGFFNGFYILKELADRASGPVIIPLENVQITDTLNFLLSPKIVAEIKKLKEKKAEEEEAKLKEGLGEEMAEVEPPVKQEEPKEEPKEESPKKPAGRPRRK